MKLTRKRRTPTEPQATAARSKRRKRFKRSPLLDRLGWYELRVEPVMSSTRQAEALNPALLAPLPLLRGPLMGTDVLTNQPIVQQPHELYAAQPRRTTSINWVILGAIGSGKSTLSKCHYCLRQVALGVQVVVFDRKNQRDDAAARGRGEYHRAAQVAEATVIRFDPAGGAVVNVLDPRITIESSTGEGGQVGQDELLLMVARHAHGELDSLERWALRAAHRTAVSKAAAAGRVATIRDVVAALFEPDASSIPLASLEERGAVTVDKMVDWGLALAFDLQRFVDGDLAGLIDSDTRAEDGGELDLSARMIVVDTSALAEDSPALSLVMAIMATFLAGVWSATSGRRQIIIEEGYHAVRLPGVAAVFRSLAKRGRGIGLSIGAVFHHVSDVPVEDDAMALIREAGIVHCFRQDKADDAAMAVELFGFPDWVAEELMTLETGTHVFRIGSETPRMVAGVRTALEEWVADTDAAIIGSSAEGDEKAPLADIPTPHPVGPGTPVEAAAHTHHHVDGGDTQ